MPEVGTDTSKGIWHSYFLFITTILIFFKLQDTMLKWCKHWFLAVQDYFESVTHSQLMASKKIASRGAFSAYITLVHAKFH